MSRFHYLQALGMKCKLLKITLNLKWNTQQRLVVRFNKLTFTVKVEQKLIEVCCPLHVKHLVYPN